MKLFDQVLIVRFPLRDLIVGKNELSDMTPESSTLQEYIYAPLPVRQKERREGRRGRRNTYSWHTYMWTTTPLSLLLSRPPVPATEKT
jgi:hypothetical protein